MDRKVNIVITDDHKLFRKGVSALLSDFDFIGEIYEAENGLELLNLLENLDEPPDVIFLDIRMPVMDGVEAQKKVREQFKDIKIIMLSMEDDGQTVLNLVEQGVNGYLLKNADPDEMEKAIKKVIANGFYFMEHLSEMIVQNLARGKVDSARQEIQFSEKELQILELICKQHTASEMGDLLHLSSRTIEGYRRKLLEKTGSRNLAGLVVFALKNNLVTV